MKDGIHPKYHNAKVVCACGTEFETMTTHAGEEIRVDICSNCHPFYTGKKKLVDSSGRVDKFKKKFNLE